MKIIYKLLLFILLGISNIGYSQLSNWTESISPKAFKVIIPDTAHLALPTSDTYTIGFFVYGTDPNLLVNVGKADYIPGATTEIQLGYDAAGNNGYVNGERLISLIYNKNNADIYGVEFIYNKGLNTFNSGDATVVTGIASSTWMDFMHGQTYVCRFTKVLLLEVPYGIKHHLKFSSGFVVDSSGVYPKILFDSMALGSSYSFEFFHTEVKFTHPLYGINLVDFPMQYLFSSYQICPGDTVVVPSSDMGGDLERSVNQYGSFNLTAGGIYYFPIFYNPTGCSFMDSVTVAVKEFPLDKINTTHYICPGDVVEVPVVDGDIKLEREIISAPGYELITPGKYIYKAKSQLSGCTLSDTIVVQNNNVNCKAVSYPELIDPAHGNGLVLPLNEKVIICNSAMQKVSEVKAPAIWYGKDNSGTLLPVGVYYIIHEDGSSNPVSIIY